MRESTAEATFCKNGSSQSSIRAFSPVWIEFESVDEKEAANAQSEIED